MTYEIDNTDLNLTGAGDNPAHFSSANEPNDGGELMAEKKILSEAIRQQNYVDAMKAEGFESGLVYARSFMEGMRDLGYKTPGWAIAELWTTAFKGCPRRSQIGVADRARSPRLLPS